MYTVNKHDANTQILKHQDKYRQNDSIKDSMAVLTLTAT